ncbi:MAG TPA: hypothetical protein VHA09_07650 [Nitrososphaera sp.]|nr:hypothetical protein [Nitrososphaera sp.]
MSGGYSEDDVRRAAELREWLMKQISDKQEELEKLRATLTIIDSVLKQGSFRAAAVLTASSSSSSSLSASSVGVAAASDQAKVAAPPSQHQRQSAGTQPQSARQAPNMTAASSQSKQQPAAASGFDPGREVRPLKRAKDDFLLANAEITANSIILTPVPGINLNVNTPPFKSFFLGRILEGMKTKDTEKTAQGAIPESAAMSYKVDEDASGIIKKITITNYRDKERMTEIFNTAAWVFTRMLEKAGS